MLTFIVNWFINENMTIEKAREALATRREEESNLPVELQVVDTKHAKSDEVMNFAIQHLSRGGTWNALRVKLGLGPAWKDKRWRVLRNSLVDSVLPENEEEALKACYAKNKYFMQKIEQYIDDADELMAQAGDKNKHHFFKSKLDALKVAMEENDREFMNYLEMKKLKVAENTKQGVSIIFQNNFHVPRPGDNAREVTPTDVVNITGQGGDE